MIDDETVQITRLLQAWRSGDDSAVDELWPLIFHQLQIIARKHMRGERSDHPFSTMDLLQEAYLKLFSNQKTDWQNRAHFFAVAATCMRNILINLANKRNTQKRGGGEIHWVPVDLTVLGDQSETHLIELDKAIEALKIKHKQTARIVEMHYFCGCTVAEIADITQVSTPTVKRRLKFAKVWLNQHMS